MSESDRAKRVNLKVYPETRDRINDRKGRASQDEYLNDLMDEEDERETLRELIREEVQSALRDHENGH